MLHWLNPNPELSAVPILPHVHNGRYESLRWIKPSSTQAWYIIRLWPSDYDITTGVQDTHALAKRFNGIVGKPNRIYMTGASMGGHITAVSIEQYKKTYDAALPVCGVLGDYALFDYFLDFNATAQQLGTGASQSPVDDAAEYIGVTVPAIKAGLEAVPGTWPFTLNEDGQNHKSLTELRSGGVRPNFEEAYGFWNSIPAATGPGNFLFELALGDGTLPRAPGNAVDNIGVVYQFDTDPTLTPDEQALNDEIVRVAADPQTFASGLAQVPRITGDIDVPVLTLHNLGDLFVPVLNQVEYVDRVAENGKSDMLVQRAIRGVLHCDFTPAEFSSAFLDLVNWVENGVKPGGDDFSDPDAVADPEFGCAYTDDIDAPHLLGTPCP